MSATTETLRGQWVRLVVLTAVGIVWVAGLWMESAALGVWGVLVWVIGGVGALTYKGRIAVFVYADFWIWIFRELLRSTRRAIG